MVYQSVHGTHARLARARAIPSNPARLQRGWLRVVLALCCAAIPAGVIRAQSGGYVFTTICPAPVVQGTNCQANGINNSGQIVGEQSPEPGPFLYDDGSFSYFNFRAFGINDAGEMVGPGGLDVAGSVGPIDFPGASATVAYGINNAGEIVGYCVDSSGNEHGFLDVAGSFSSIDFPGASATGAYGINASGQIVGSYRDSSNNEHGFLYSAGSFSSIDFPGAYLTISQGINDAGEIVGHYQDSNTDAPGFLDVAGTFTSLYFSPGALTEVWGINNAGEIVGWALVETGTPTIGFLAVPATVVNVSPTTINFGNQLVGATSSAQTVTLTNAGTVILDVSSTSATGDFAAQGGTCNSPVPVAGSCTIPVTFTPTAIGTRTGTLTVTDNANPQTQTVSLTGMGIAPEVSLSQLSLTFPSQPVNTTSTAQTLTLTNNGSATLGINSIAISGDFAQSNTCGASVAPGTNCEISVTFTPSVIGTRKPKPSQSPTTPATALRP